MGTLIVRDAKNGTDATPATAANIPCQSINVGTGAALTFHDPADDPAQAEPAGLFYRFQAPSAIACSYRLAVTNSKVQAFRGVFRVPTVTTARTIMTPRWATGPSHRWRIESTGRFVISDAATSPVILAGGTGPTLTQGNYYELIANYNIGSSATTGTLTIVICPVGTSTPVTGGTITLTAADLGGANLTGGAVITHYDVGANDAAASAVDLIWTNLQFENDRTTQLPLYVPSVANTAPVVNAGADVTIDAGERYTLTGTYTDAEGGTMSRSWLSGATTLTTGDTYAIVGPITLAGNTTTYTYRVADPGGLVTTDTVTVTTRPAPNRIQMGGALRPYVTLFTTGVGSTPPNVLPTASFNAFPDALTVTVMDASTDPDGSIVTRSWAWGDGTASTTGTPSVASHTYATVGTFTITLTVTDNSGGTATTTRSVTTTAPTIVGNNVIGTAGQESLVGGWATVSKFTAPARYGVTEARAYLDGAGTQVTAGVKQTLTAVLYADNGAGRPGALLGTSGSIQVTAADAAAWRTFTFPAMDIPAGPVWLGILIGLAHNVARLYYNTGTGDIRRYKSTTTAPNPWGTDGGGDSRQYSIYLTGGTSTAPAKGLNDTFGKFWSTPLPAGQEVFPDALPADATAAARVGGFTGAPDTRTGTMTGGATWTRVAPGSNPPRGLTQRERFALLAKGTYALPTYTPGYFATISPNAAPLYIVRDPNHFKQKVTWIGSNGVAVSPTSSDPLQAAIDLVPFPVGATPAGGGTPARFDAATTATPAGYGRVPWGAGTDQQLAIYDVTTDTLYEFWIANYGASGVTCRYAGVLRNASTTRRATLELGGSRATGLPLLPGNITREEWENGVIRHPIFVGVPAVLATKPDGTPGWIAPANRQDGNIVINQANNNPTAAMYEGTWLRLPAGYDAQTLPSGYTYAQTNANAAKLWRMIVTAARDYGIVIADGTGGAVAFSIEGTQAIGTPYSSLTSSSLPVQTNDSNGPFYGSNAVTKYLPWDDLVQIAPVVPPFDPPAVASAAGFNTLLFSDDFDGTTLNTAKWNATGTGSTLDTTEGGSNDGGNQELQWYEPAQVTVSGGALRLATVSNPKPVPQNWLDAAWWDESYLPIINGVRSFPYRSGAVNTKGKFALPANNYVVEWRAKYSTHLGSWFALWSLPVSTPGWPTGGEVDLLEQVGSKPWWVDASTGTVYTEAYRASRNVHWVDAQGVHHDEPGVYESVAPGHPVYDGPVLANTLHTWAVKVTPTSITYYLDGVQLGSSVVGAEKVPDRPHYLIANVAAGGTWPTNPDAGSVAEMPWGSSIEWVRVWG